MAPLVSLVMPTYNRTKYVPMAIRCFEQQTYPDLELIIVDDGTEMIALPQDSRIRYIHLGTRTTTGAKRNIGAEAARGEIIAALDDDDWSAPHRIEDEVKRLLRTGKSVTGYSETVRFDEATGLFYLIPANNPFPASGTSQCYLKSWWEKHPFSEISLGEDMEFSRIAIMNDELVTAPVGKMMVAVKHGANTSSVTLDARDLISGSQVPPEFIKAFASSEPTQSYMLEKHQCSSECDAEAKAQFNVVPHMRKASKNLIAIESCHRDRDNGVQQSQRDTWIKDTCLLNFDYRFFIGRPIEQETFDEVFLDVDDTYASLAFKTQAICRWAFDQGYDFLYKTDTDTLVVPMRLLASGFELHNYMGGRNSDFTPEAYRQRKGSHPGKRIEFASGGSGYWLSRKAMEIVADSTDMKYAGFAEDVFVAIALHGAGILPTWNENMKWYPGVTMDNKTVSYHLSSALQKKFEPPMMHEYYKKARQS